VSGAERLYTPELLARTLKLASFPLDESLPLAGVARSKSCGSTLALRMALGDDRRIAKLGLRVQACAVGQASAALFAEAAIGRAQEEMRAWLTGDGPLPHWPGIELLEPARAYPARHGAMLLPWDAALAALSSAAASH
jgi:NifU-like protein involved in Fe-S cluster formation